jgi:hypothetical protein
VGKWARRMGRWVPDRSQQKYCLDGHDRWGRPKPVEILSGGIMGTAVGPWVTEAGRDTLWGDNGHDRWALGADRSQ